MKKILPILVAATLVTTISGCTGPFSLTKRVHTFQTSFDDKWVDEVAFLGCVFFPVYGFSTIVDALILNSVEFWTGDNPMDTVLLEQDGHKAIMTLRDDNKIEIKSGAKTVLLEKTLKGVIATDTEGSFLYRAHKGTDQAIRLYDAQNELIKSSNI